MNYQYITNTQQLNNFCRPLHQQAWIAMDTEFVRQDTYYPLLSLVQICSQDGELAIIDPLAIDDLSPLWALLTDSKLCKVFHSARQDIEVLYQVSGQMPTNLFDTQIACVFIGYGDLAGFARVIEGELGEKLDKDQTRTNWHQRPLSTKQITYALDDVRFLAPLYQHLQTRLTTEQKQALTWDFAQLLAPSLYDIAPQQAWLKLKGTQGLNQKQLALVQALAAWRESQAIALNQPRKWILSDEGLLALAKQPKRDVESLFKLKDLNPSLIRQFGEQWITLIDQVLAQSETWPTAPIKPAPASAQEDVLINLLQAYALQITLDYHLNTSTLFQRKDLLALLRGQGNTALHQGWRYALLGRDLMRLINGEACLNVHGAHLSLVKA
ncbi:MAG: ribonuclease D [Thiomicrospira sp.]|jgi:ribonuclease D|nr:ribonuclease D [Thiomicrospira sp.]